MQSFEEIRLPLLGDIKRREDETSGQGRKSKPKVRFLVENEFRTLVVPESLTTVQHKMETEGNTRNNKPEESHATLQNEGPRRLEDQRTAVPRRSTRENTTNHASVRYAQEIIQERNENLRLLLKEQDELRNEVAMADHTIMQLKARLAETNYSLNNTTNHEKALRLEAEKLKHEKVKLNKRCENAMWETASRLRAKDEKVRNVQAEINKTLRLCDEVTKRNQDLKGRLERRGKVASGLRTKFALMSNWSVRHSPPS